MNLTVRVGERELRHGDPRVRAATGCDCVACRRVLEDGPLSPKAAMLAANPSLARHGTVSTYNNWGCRCERCRDAARDYSKRRRAASKLDRGPAVRSMLERVFVTLAAARATAMPADERAEEVGDVHTHVLGELNDHFEERCSICNRKVELVITVVGERWRHVHEPSPKDHDAVCGASWGPTPAASGAGQAGEEVRDARP